MAVKVKICGITSLPDALAAVEAGADLLGFVFYERSPRYVRLRQAAEICRRIPTATIRVGVFVNAPVDTVKAAAGECELNMLQFHGDEPPDYCLGFGMSSMKAFRIAGRASLERLRSYSTDAWLLDAFSAGGLGGTGETFNWDLAAEARRWGRPIFLAGGLNPGNVGEAIRQVRPYGVDVSSGVETAPGLKDHEKIKAFVESVRSTT